jgi:gluconolactonase
MQNRKVRLGIYLVCIASILPAQDFANLKAERMATSRKFTEGPVWSKDGYLLYSDIPNNQIIKLSSQGASIYRENSNGANGNTFDEDGRLYTCESHTRRITRTDKKGKIEVLTEKFEGKRFNAPNDVIVSKSGHVYFTDPAFGPTQAEGRELSFYGVYHITPKGEISVVARSEGRPNGIALSPDGKTLYVTNSDERNVRAYDIGRNGVPSNERILIAGIEGVPDGMTTDEKGRLYVTGKQVYVYAPDGKMLGTIQVPETPSNVAFGDGDLMGLYITARTSVYRVRLDVKGALHY